MLMVIVYLQDCDSTDSMEYSSDSDREEIVPPAARSGPATPEQVPEAATKPAVTSEPEAGAEKRPEPAVKPIAKPAEVKDKTAKPVAKTGEMKPEPTRTADPKVERAAVAAPSTTGTVATAKAPVAAGPTGTAPAASAANTDKDLTADKPKTAGPKAAPTAPIKTK